MWLRGGCVLKGVALDFDGVILESIQVKARAFRVLFQDYPDHIEQILRLHLDKGGMSRFEKFRIIYRDYLKKSLDERESERLSREFSELITREMLACPYVPGAIEFLRRRATSLPLFIVSGAPEEELRAIVSRRNLADYFNGLYGSPRLKPRLLSEILDGNGWSPQEMVMVGDSIIDFEAADSLGIPFIGRVAWGAVNPFPPRVRWIVTDMDELDKRWPSFLDQFNRQDCVDDYC